MVLHLLGVYGSIAAIERRHRTDVHGRTAACDLTYSNE